MRLVYRPNGHPFSADNLSVTFPDGALPGRLALVMPAAGNLGGPVATWTTRAAPSTSRRG